MDLTEKIAYIKGLAEGLSLDESKPEVKVINAIIDLLDDITYDVQNMEELYDELSEEVDEIDQDLADVEDELFDDDDEDPISVKSSSIISMMEIIVSDRYGLTSMERNTIDKCVKQIYNRFFANNI